MPSNQDNNLEINSLNSKDSLNYKESLGVIYKDAIKYAPSKIVGAILNIVAVSFYTNLLMPKEYGLYMVATGVINFLAIIFSDWIGISALRFFREHFKRDNIGSYFSTILVLLLINLSAMYLSGLLFFKPLSEFFKIPTNYLIVVFVLIIPIAIRALLFQILRAQIKPLTYTSSVIINQFMTIAIAVSLIKYYDMGAVGILAGMALAILFIDITMIFLTSFHKSVDHEKIHYKTLSTLYAYGIPIAASSIGMWLLTQSNRFILQYYKGSELNGTLGVGYNLTFSIVMPLFAIMTLASIPRIINYFEDGKDVTPLIRKLVEIYFILFLPLTVFLCIYPSEVVTLFSNSNFAGAFILIPFLSLSAFTLGLTELTVIQYYLVKKPKIDMAIRLVSGVFGIILNIIFLPQYGLLAIGISALAAQALYLLFSCIIRIKSIQWEFPHKTVIKTAIASALCFIASILFRNILPAHSILGFTAHILMFFAIYTALVKLVPQLKVL